MSKEQDNTLWSKTIILYNHDECDMSVTKMMMNNKSDDDNNDDSDGDVNDCNYVTW